MGKAAYSMPGRQDCCGCHLVDTCSDGFDHTVSEPVLMTYRNLLRKGRQKEDALRSAIVVLRIHQPEVCKEKMDHVSRWLLARALN